ncbi:RICIN domain-containing protein [Sedimentisphaera salicampi]|uniref:RICIN domain-containing protein n=1 Tax=Sedimentisphaera salicampi TaxID=1941349 RepID=UPI000B9CB813|nr:RICIN domain-containing protein [Sedimentisphaera salicampi]OXU15279.1 Flavastacin precursor [Sedimentisphaera salicampi]
MKKSGISILTAALLLFIPCMGWSAQNVVIDKSTCWGEWEGWGCSLCWWAAEFGHRHDLADILFTYDYTDLNGKSLPGLGMNIVRYNAGACSWNSINGTEMQESPNIHDTRQMEGFWIDWLSSDPYSASWDWSVDDRQRQMLQKAKARGANRFELFSNSPMWWMCKNNNPSGSESGSEDNLAQDRFDDHAVYMATVAKYYQEHFGVSFTTVDPFNEPIADWWDADNNQEGCHFDRSSQAQIISLLRNELDSRGLSELKISASDESHFSMALSTLDAFEAETKSKIGQTNVHGYQRTNGPREELYYRNAGKRLWNSEYGGNDLTGIEMAKNICLDFRYLHPNAWCYWQPLDWANWGLIDANLPNSWVGQAENKFFALAQFTRKIQQGDLILNSGREDMVVSCSPEKERLVIVVVNDSETENYTFDLSAFQAAEGPVKNWRTLADSSEQYQRKSDIAISGKSFTAEIAENSIHTFVVKNFVQPAETIGNRPKPGFWYRITPQHSGKCIEVNGSSSADGANVEQNSFSGGENQQWKLEDAEEGFFRITPRHAQDKCLSVKNQSAGNGASLQQLSYTGHTSQKWRLVPSEDGKFALTAQNSEKAMDVSSVSSDDGANIIQWPGSGNDNQRFEFAEIEPVCSISPAQGDINEDCKVNLADLEIAAENWLSDCLGSGMEEMLGAECSVNLAHLAIIADNWQITGLQD